MALSSKSNHYRDVAGYDFSPGRVREGFRPSGRAKGWFVKREPTEPADDWTAFCQLVDGLSSYSYPRAGPSEELRILSAQIAGATRVADERIIDLEYEAMQDLLAPYLGTVPAPVWSTNRHCLPNPRDVLDIYPTLSKTAGPGFPYLHEQSLKHVMFLQEFDFIYWLVCMRLLSLQHVDPQTMTAQERVERSFFDPCAVKIKSEIGKFEHKNARLIFAVSIVDFCIEQLLFGPVADATKREPGRYYSMVGTGFEESDAERISDLLADFGTTASTDTPKFDFTVAQGENTAGGITLIDCYDSPPKTFALMCLRHMQVWEDPAFVLSSGEVLFLYLLGITISGRFLTTILNTIYRAARAAVCQQIAQLFEKLNPSTPASSVSPSLLREACLEHKYVPGPYPKVRAGGDDCFEQFHRDLFSVYSAIGWPLRDEEVSTTTLSFFSHDWGPNRRPVSQRVVKGFANLIHGHASSDQLRGFVNEYGNHPRFNELLSLALSVRQGVNLLEENKSDQPFCADLPIHNVRAYSKTTQGSKSPHQLSGQTPDPRRSFHRPSRPWSLSSSSAKRCSGPEEEENSQSKGESEQVSSCPLPNADHPERPSRGSLRAGQPVLPRSSEREVSRPVLGELRDFPVSRSLFGSFERIRKCRRHLYARLRPPLLYRFDCYGCWNDGLLDKLGCPGWSCDLHERELVPHQQHGHQNSIAPVCGQELRHDSRQRFQRHLRSEPDLSRRISLHERLCLRRSFGSVQRDVCDFQAHQPDFDAVCFSKCDELRPLANKLGCPRLATSDHLHGLRKCVDLKLRYRVRCQLRTCFRRRIRLCPDRNPTSQGQLLAAGCRLNGVRHPWPRHHCLSTSSSSRGDGRRAGRILGSYVNPRLRSPLVPPVPNTPLCHSGMAS